MSVTGQDVVEFYTADGIGQDFAYPNYFMAFADLLVQVTPVGGDPVTKAYITDYTVSGAADIAGAYPVGGTVHMLAAPLSGSIVTISRVTPKTQPVHYVDQDTFPAKAHEHALDRLCLIVQEMLAGFKGLAAGPPTSGTYAVDDWFRASPAVPGGPFGYICTAAGSPGTWNPFGGISL